MAELKRLSAPKLLKSNVAFTGGLVKINKKGKAQLRFCVLHDRHFFYYEKKDSVKPKGVFDLHGYHAKSRPSADGGKILLELVHDFKRTYVFLVGTSEEADQWVNCINVFICSYTSPVSSHTSNLYVPGNHHRHGDLVRTGSTSSSASSNSTSSRGSTKSHVSDSIEEVLYEDVDKEDVQYVDVLSSLSHYDVPNRHIYESTDMPADELYVAMSNLNESENKLDYYDSPKNIVERRIPTPGEKNLYTCDSQLIPCSAEGNYESMLCILNDKQNRKNSFDTDAKHDNPTEEDKYVTILGDINAIQDRKQIFNTVQPIQCEEENKYESMSGDLSDRQDLGTIQKYAEENKYESMSGDLSDKQDLDTIQKYDNFEPIQCAEENKYESISGDLSDRQDLDTIQKYDNFEPIKCAEEDKYVTILGDLNEIQDRKQSFNTVQPIQCAEENKYESMSGDLSDRKNLGTIQKHDNFEPIQCSEEDKYMSMSDNTSFDITSGKSVQTSGYFADTNRDDALLTAKLNGAALEEIYQNPHNYYDLSSPDCDLSRLGLIKIKDSFIENNDNNNTIWKESSEVLLPPVRHQRSNSAPEQEYLGDRLINKTKNRAPIPAPRKRSDVAKKERPVSENPYHCSPRNTPLEPRLEAVDTEPTGEGTSDQIDGSSDTYLDLESLMNPKPENHEIDDADTEYGYLCIDFSSSPSKKHQSLPTRVSSSKSSYQDPDLVLNPSSFKDAALPPLPRTPTEEFPTNVILPSTVFLPDFDKNLCIAYMKNCRAGTYLIRTQRPDGKDALAVKTDNDVKHYIIFNKHDLFYLKSDHPSFTTVPDLIRHYYSHPLPTCIQKLKTPYR